MNHFISRLVTQNLSRNLYSSSPASRLEKASMVKPRFDSNRYNNRHFNDSNLNDNGHGATPIPESESGENDSLIHVSNATTSKTQINLDIESTKNNDIKNNVDSGDTGSNSTNTKKPTAGIPEFTTDNTTNNHHNANPIMSGESLSSNFYSPSSTYDVPDNSVTEVLSPGKLNPEKLNSKKENAKNQSIIKNKAILSSDLLSPVAASNTNYNSNNVNTMPAFNESNFSQPNRASFSYHDQTEQVKNEIIEPLSQADQLRYVDDLSTVTNPQLTRASVSTSVNAKNTTTPVVKPNSPDGLPPLELDLRNENRLSARLVQHQQFNAVAVTKTSDVDSTQTPGETLKSPMPDSVKFETLARSSSQIILTPSSQSSIKEQPFAEVNATASYATRNNTESSTSAQAIVTISIGRIEFLASDPVTLPSKATAKSSRRVPGMSLSHYLAKQKGAQQ